MAELTHNKSNDFVLALEDLGTTKLFSISEISLMIRKMKEFEYKIKTQVKSKEAYVLYTRYLKSLMEIVKQRREKKEMTKRSYAESIAASKIFDIYKNSLKEFPDEIRFYKAYLSFCKIENFKNYANETVNEIVNLHVDKPEYCHLAVRWEMEGNENFESAKNIVLKGLKFHPESMLLYIDLIQLELDLAFLKVESKSKEESESKSLETNKESNLNRENHLKNLFTAYEAAFKNVNNVNFIIMLLNMVEQYENTEKLQNKIMSDMIENFPWAPVIYDKMAHRELKGLAPLYLGTEYTAMMNMHEIDEIPLHDRLNNCYLIYKKATEFIKDQEIWDLFIKCMVEINTDMDEIPVLKRKLLKNALFAGHKANKLKEEHYLLWIELFNIDQVVTDPEAQEKLHEVLCYATEAMPQSENLWRTRYHSYLSLNKHDLADATFKKGVDVLGENSFGLWKLRLLYLQKKKSQDLEAYFYEALKQNITISSYIKPIYMEWVLLNKDLITSRKIYKELYLQPPLCLELHKKMANFELWLPEISIPNARKPREIATMQFGIENVDVWLDLITFEIRHGDATKVSSIYSSAIKTLKPELSQQFTNEFMSLTEHYK